MINYIYCFFKGHTPCTAERKKKIKYALNMYGLDAWGSDAFSNMKIMDQLEKELVSCSRCGQPATEGVGE